MAGGAKMNQIVEMDQMTTTPSIVRAMSARWTQALCATLGFVTFWPVGMTYLLMTMLIGSIVIQRSQWSSRWQGLRSHAILGILAFAVIWPALTMLWHPLFNDTGTRLFHIVRVSVILMVGLLLLERERDWALRGFILGALVAAVIISVHYVRPLPEWDPWKHLLLRKAHNASQKMVGMVSAAVVLLVFMWHRPMSLHLKLACLIGSVWLSGIVLMHGTSRNAFMLVVILPVAVVAYKLRNIKAWALAGCLIAVAAFSLSQLKPDVLNKVNASLSNVTRSAELEYSESSMNIRIKMWRTAVEQLHQYPIQGAGLGSWRAIWSQTPYLAQDSSYRTSNNPHNDYLLNAAETGILGLLSVVAIVAWFAWRSWRMNSLWGATAFCLTCAVAVTAFVNAPFRDGGFGMSLMWLMAAAAAASYSSTNTSSA